MDVQKKATEAVAAEIEGAGGRAVPFVADVADPEQVRAPVDLAVSTFGGLHLAVNNAGITGPLALLADIGIAGYRRVIEINLNAVFYGMYYEIPAMLASGGGSIVNTSSILGLAGDPTAVPYVTANHVAEYYRLAFNRHRLGQLKYVMERSLTKTLARKYRITVPRPAAATVPRPAPGTARAVACRPPWTGTANPAGRTMGRHLPRA